MLFAHLNETSNINNGQCNLFFGLAALRNKQICNKADKKEILKSRRCHTRNIVFNPQPMITIIFISHIHQTIVLCCFRYIFVPTSVYSKSSGLRRKTY